MQKAPAGLRRINLEGLRWRVFDASLGIYKLPGIFQDRSQLTSIADSKDFSTSRHFFSAKGTCLFIESHAA